MHKGPVSLFISGRSEFELARRSVVVVMGVLAGLLSGCATNPGAVSEASPSKEQAVAKRAEGFWGRRLAGDVDGAYLFTSPGTREVLSPSAYKAGVNPRIWKTAKVTGVECSSDDSCRVKLTVGFQVRMRMGASVDGEQEVIETWLRKDGQWWIVPDRLETRIGQ
jgi:hypothetical protein